VDEYDRRPPACVRLLDLPRFPLGDSGHVILLPTSHPGVAA
jgi:hypothetical protein